MPYLKEFRADIRSPVVTDNLRSWSSAKRLTFDFGIRDCSAVRLARNTFGK